MNTALFIIFIILPIIYSTLFVQSPYSSVICNRYQTEALRGIAIIMVIISHYSLAMGIPFLGFLGGVGVALFLFLSGYGLNESYKKNGLNKYFSKKVYRVMIPYWILMITLALLFWKTFNYKIFLLDIFGIKTSYWYIGFIIRWYIIFYVSKLLPNKYSNIVIYIYSIIVLFVYPEHQNLQFLSFPIGVIVSDNIFSIRCLSKKIYILSAVAFLVLGLSLFLIYYRFLDEFLSSNYILSGFFKSFYYLSFTFSIVLFVNLFPRLFITSYSIFLGSISYELYLIHMQFLKIDSFFISDRKHWYIWIVAFLLSIILSMILKSIQSKITKHLKSNENLV